MHSLIEIFVETSTEIDDVLKAYIDRRTPVIEAIQLLSDMIKGDQAANGALFIARNTPINDEDANLGILMLAYWARAITPLIRTLPEKTTEARTVIHRAKNIMTPVTPKEIRALIELTDAQIADSEGNVIDRDSIMQSALKKLSPSSPRYPWLIAQYSLMLARSGRLSELSKRLASIETSSAWQDVASCITLAKFINHAETCNIHQAQQILPAVLRQAFPRLESQMRDNYLTLMPLLESALSTSTHLTANQNPADDVTPDWALTIRALTAGTSHQALKWARISEKRDPVCMTGSSLTSTNLIRAELAERNADAAKRLISLRRAKGNAHYLDALHEARCLLLQGSLESAGELFCTATTDAEAHNARHRLELEMTLAVEIPNHVIMQLMQRLGRHAKPREQPAPAPPSEPTPQPVYAEGLNSIVGASRATGELKRTISHFAKMDVPVLITGETGTGKDLVARAIHEESTRKNEPFIAVNCASISENLLESELFGHEKGAFTGASTARKGLFEEAGRGSIFLDEIGEISPRLQASLLRVLESGEIRPVGSSAPRTTSCRIITATNANLSRMAEEGRFRNDVLFRLKRLEIHIPPLRERTEDILPLTSFFLNLNRIGDTNAVISEDLCRLMLSHQWPGNVRELRNAIERMRLMNSDKLYYEIEDIGLPTPSHQETIPAEATQMDAGKSIPDKKNAMPPGSNYNLNMRTGMPRMRRLIALKDMFQEHTVLTRSEIMQILGISPNAATSDLKNLVAEGYIERIQPTKSARSTYFKIRMKQDQE